MFFFFFLENFKVVYPTLSMRKSFVETKYDALSIKHVYILKVYSFLYSLVKFYAKTIYQTNKFGFFLFKYE